MPGWSERPTLQKAGAGCATTVLDVGRMIGGDLDLSKRSSSQVRISFQPGERALVSANALLKDARNRQERDHIPVDGDIDIIVGAEEGKEFVRWTSPTPDRHQMMW